MFGAGNSTGVGGNAVVDTRGGGGGGCVCCKVVWGGVCGVRVGGGFVAVTVLVRGSGAVVIELWSRVRVGEVLCVGF